MKALRPEMCPRIIGHVATVTRLCMTAKKPYPLGGSGRGYYGYMAFIIALPKTQWARTAGGGYVNFHCYKISRNQKGGKTIV